MFVAVQLHNASLTWHPGPHVDFCLPFILLGDGCVVLVNILLTRRCRSCSWLRYDSNTAVSTKMTRNRMTTRMSIESPAVGR